MITIQELNINDWFGYIFKEMGNILDIFPGYLTINEFKECKDGSTVFNLCYLEKNNAPQIAFNNIDCIFRKSGVFSYLIFCRDEKK